MATQVDGPVLSHDPVIPSLHDKSEKHCIICGRYHFIVLCSRCKGVWYCDKMCQEEDWRYHKILCSKFAKVNENEPLSDGYRAILFRYDSLEPEIIILPNSQNGRRASDSVVDLLRKSDNETDNPTVERLVLELDGRVGKNQIQVANYTTDRSKSNKSLFASLRSIGIENPPPFWAGNIVARRTDSTSVTMADFSHILKWFAAYPYHKQQMPAALPEAPWRFDAIESVLISGDHLIENKKSYIPVTISADHPIRGLMKELDGHISPISIRVGLPLRLIMRVDRDGVCEVDPYGRILTCGPATALMRSLDKASDLFPPGWLDCLLDKDLQSVDQVLVVRADDKDLSVDDARAMMYFSETMCLEVLRGIALTPPMDKQGMEVARQKALDFITRENYLLAFDELGIPRPEWSAEETFVDVHGPGMPDLDEDDEWLPDADDESDDDNAEDEDESDD